MTHYEVGKNWFIAALGRTVYPGDVIELPQEVADHLIHNEPGLLKEVRHTTQAKATTVRGSKKVKIHRTRN